MGEFPLVPAKALPWLWTLIDALREHYERQNEGAFRCIMGQNHVALRGQK